MEHLALGKHILVKEVVNEENKTDGGIVLPNDISSVSATSKRSVVVSISEELLESQGHTNHFQGLKVGDYVYHAYHSGVYINTKDKQKLISLHIDCVLAKEVGR